MARDPTQTANHSAGDVPTRKTTSADNLIAETRVTFDGSEDVAVAVVDVIARERGEPVSELVSSIDEAVDPDALNRIVRPHADGSTRTGWVTFFLCDCMVRLYSDGRLQIFDCTDSPPSE